MNALKTRSGPPRHYKGSISIDQQRRILTLAATAIEQPDACTHQLALDKNEASADVFGEAAVQRSPDGWILKVAYDLLEKETRMQPRIAAHVALDLIDRRLRWLLSPLFRSSEASESDISIGIVALSFNYPPQSIALILRGLADGFPPEEKPPEGRTT